MDNRAAHVYTCLFGGAEFYLRVQNAYLFFFILILFFSSESLRSKKG